MLIVKGNEGWVEGGKSREVDGVVEVFIVFDHCCCCCFLEI